MLLTLFAFRRSSFLGGHAHKVFSYTLQFNTFISTQCFYRFWPEKKGKRMITLANIAMCKLPYSILTVCVRIEMFP